MRIDAIIAWVDGADPVHRAARAKFAGRTPQGDGGDGRYVQSGEVYVAIASILKYAPFIHRIHVLTDGQRPDDLDGFAARGLCPHDRIVLVHHDAIFRGLPAARPNFNCRAIEGAMHRVPDLAEHFVYFNDDMFLNRPATAHDFFADGAPVIGGAWQVPSNRRPLKRLETTLRRAINRPDLRPSHQAVQETGAALMGFTDRFLRAPHCPHPLRKSTMQSALDANPGLLNRQVGFRFRDRAQYQPVALANHAEIAAGLTPGPMPDIAYLRDRTGAAFDRILARIADGTAQFACIQNLESMPHHRRAGVLDTLTAKFASHLPPGALAALTAPTT